MKKKKHLFIQKSSSILLTGLLFLNSGCTNNTQPSETKDTVKSIAKVEYTSCNSSSEIFVKQVENLPEDFILGADVSSLIAEENSGVKYYDENGKEADLLLTLARNNINTIRVRVWNDPYDENKNGYGGGNNDIQTALLIGQRATSYGLSLMVDFHYSDFWADPSKQMCPKAWEGMTPSEKGEAAYQYTYDSLDLLLSNGVDVSIVQIGNETTTGLSGEKSWDNFYQIMEGGSKAIREISSKYDQDIKIAVHFTNPETPDHYLEYARNLSDYHIDYDIFASSYYPYWHGTVDNLTSILKKIGVIYNKKVMVAEFSYAYTYENGDASGNSISESSACEFPYSVSIQGQADCIREITQAIVNCNGYGIGICYWEPAWIPVPGNTFEDQSNLWETYGSGWASSYAKDYDPNDAGKYYGGSSWDNQALFDFDGHPLPSLSTFRFLSTGASCDLKIDSITDLELEYVNGTEIIIPEEFPVKLNNGEIISIPVSWNNLDSIDFTTNGDKLITGVIEYNDTVFNVNCVIHIISTNYVLNGSFEDDDLSMWTITNPDDITTELFVSPKSVDAIEGSNSFHYYSAGNVDFTLEQTITNLEPGTYQFSLGIHGGDCNNQQFELYVIADGKTYTQACGVTAWKEITYPTISNISSSDGTILIGVKISCYPGGWGNIDKVQLTRQ